MLVLGNAPRVILDQLYDGPGKRYKFDGFDEFMFTIEDCKRKPLANWDVVDSYGHPVESGSGRVDGGYDDIIASAWAVVSSNTSTVDVDMSHDWVPYDMSKWSYDPVTDMFFRVVDGLYFNIMTNHESESKPLYGYIKDRERTYASIIEDSWYSMVRHMNHHVNRNRELQDKYFEKVA